MLNASRDSLPTSLVLVKEGKVLGHLRMKHLDSLPRAVWIESVVVDKALRGKGYGKALMLRAEEYAKKMEFEVAYLNTHDKEGFYGSLGYELCPPVSVYAKPINDGWKPNVEAIKEYRDVSNNSASDLSSHSCPQPIASSDSKLNNYNNMERHESLSNGSVISLNDSLSFLSVNDSCGHSNDAAKSNTVQNQSSEESLTSLSAVDSSVLKPTPTNNNPIHTLSKSPPSQQVVVDASLVTSSICDPLSSLSSKSSKASPPSISPPLQQTSAITSSPTTMNMIPPPASTALTAAAPLPPPPPPPPAPPIPRSLLSRTLNSKTEICASQDEGKVALKTLYMVKLLI